MAPALKTKRGNITRYGFACGYMETRWLRDHLHYVRIEQICSNGALLVRVSGPNDRRDLYAGTSLSLARKAFNSIKEPHS